MAECSPHSSHSITALVFAQPCQALLAPVPSSRAAIEDLLSCSMTDGSRGYRLEASTKGDLRPLLRRLPLACARACFLVVPQVAHPEALWVVLCYVRARATAGLSLFEPHSLVGDKLLGVRVRL